MGFFDSLLGKRPPAIESRGGMCVIRNVEIASRIAPPTTTGGPGPQSCERCGREMPELLITTGGPLGDPDVWLAAPVAVDGWACVDCGSFRYPRVMSVVAILDIEREGVALGRDGNYLEAEWRFVRLVWDWPGYLPGHVLYAEALRDRLHHGERLDAAVVRTLRERMREQYEAATEAYAEAPISGVEPMIARATVTLAELAIEDRAFDRARRALETCFAIEPLDDASRTQAETLTRYMDERHDLFESASKALMPHLDLMGRAPLPIDGPDARKRVVQAIEQLEVHLALAPDRWQAKWMLAKGRAALGETAAALDVWRRARRAHPEEKDIARETSLALLRAGHTTEARDSDREATARFPDDATLWSNRGLSELLAGDLGEARRAIDESRRLDPKDPVSRAVETRIARCEKGAAIPRSLAELEKG